MYHPSHPENRMPPAPAPAPSPVTEPDAYIASLLAALGSRDPLAVMAETADTLRRLTSGVSPDRLATPEAAGKWSLLHVIQHLADSEIVAAFRFRMVLAQDRPAIAGYDQDLWASRLRYSEVDLEEAIGQFAALRAANLRVLARTTPAERARVGIHAERGEESIEKMIRIYAGHDLVHCRQMSRIKAAVVA
jgi:hypothetical protein